MASLIQFIKKSDSTSGYHCNGYLCSISCIVLLSSVCTLIEHNVNAFESTSFTLDEVLSVNYGIHSKGFLVYFELSRY